MLKIKWNKKIIIYLIMSVWYIFKYELQKQDYLCGKCYKWHNKYKIMINAQINDDIDRQTS